MLVLQPYRLVYLSGDSIWGKMGKQLGLDWHERDEHGVTCRPATRVAWCKELMNLMTPG